MEARELQENAEHAESKGMKAVGLTTAIVAVILALATLLGHRAHTEEIKLQTKVNDGWSFYQAKHNRAHEYGIFAENEALANRNDVALKDLRISTVEECGSPVEGDCTSPVLKDSAVLRQLLEHNGGGKSGEHGAASETPSETGASPQKEGRSLARPRSQKSANRKDGAVDIQEHTRELEKETELISSRADRYDTADLFLEISIVLCSITLLAGSKLYWRLSFITITIGVAFMLWGLLLR